MPKLYYSPTSCGAANFISAYYGGVPLKCEQVNLATHKTQSGADFYTINPKGNVPAIVFEDGTVLNENAATLQFIADQATGRTLAPPNGSMPRYLEQVALSFIATELHALMDPLFSPVVSSKMRSFTVERLQKKFEFMDKSFIADKSFIVGDSFTVADAYLYVVLSWTPYLKLDLSPYSNVQRYFNGIGAMEEVKAAQERMASNPPTTV